MLSGWVVPTGHSPRYFCARASVVFLAGIISRSVGSNETSLFSDVIEDTHFHMTCPTLSGNTFQGLYYIPFHYITTIPQGIKRVGFSRFYISIAED